MSKRTKQELIEGIKKILVDLFDSHWTDRWIESKHRAITSLIQLHGITPNYSCALIEEFKKGGFIEQQNKGAHMRYKILGSTIPDFDVLASKIYDNHLERKRSYTEFEGYKNSSPDELRPPKRKYTRRTPVNENGKAVVVNRREYKLKDRVYILNNDTIFEGYIIGMELATLTSDKISYKICVTNNVIRTERVYSTIEGVLQYMRNRLIKY